MTVDMHGAAVTPSARSIVIEDGPLAVVTYESRVHHADALLIHGFTGSKEDFSEIGPLLATRGYRVVTLDNRGQHESAHSERDDAYTIPWLARDAIAVADHLGLVRPHLLGHSFGGMVAQKAVVSAPGRWASLTLLCSGPQGRPDAADLATTMATVSSHTMTEAWDLTHAPGEPRDAREAFLRRRWVMSDARSVLTHAGHLLSESSILAAVRATGLPAHVVYGEHDDAWPLALQDQRAIDLDAELTVIADAGHSPNQDQPERTAAILAGFWDRHL